MVSDHVKKERKKIRKEIKEERNINNQRKFDHEWKEQKKETREDDISWSLL